MRFRATFLMIDKEKQSGSRRRRPAADSWHLTPCIIPGTWYTKMVGVRSGCMLIEWIFLFHALWLAKGYFESGAISLGSFQATASRIRSDTYDIITRISNASTASSIAWGGGLITTFQASCMMILNLQPCQAFDRFGWWMDRCPTFQASCVLFLTFRASWAMLVGFFTKQNVKYYFCR